MEMHWQLLFLKYSSSALRPDVTRARCLAFILRAKYFSEGNTTDIRLANYLMFKMKIKELKPLHWMR